MLSVHIHKKSLQKPNVLSEERQTMQLAKEKKEQKYKQWFTKHYAEN